MAPMPPAAPASEAPTVIAKKTPGKNGTELFFKTNVYPLTVQKKIPYFKNDFRIVINATSSDGSKPYSRELTNSSKYYDDATRKEANVCVLHAMMALPEWSNRTAIYDRGAILFTVEEVVTGAEELKYSFPRSSLGANSLFDRVTKVEVTIKKATDRYQITSDDYLAAAGADFVEDGDKSIFELLNIATSQSVVDHSDEVRADGRSRIIILQSQGVQVNTRTAIGDGQVLMTSIKKSVKTIENTPVNGKLVPIPALIVDVSKRAMHEPMLLSQKMKFGLMNKAFENLRCVKNYGNHEVILIHHVSNELVADHVIPEIRVKMTKYMKDKYNITLKETRLYTVVDKKGHHYAPEALQVLEQPVLREQESSKTASTVIRANATPGEERLRSVNALMGALHLGDNDARDRGVMLSPGAPDGMRVKGRQIPQMTMQFAAGKKTLGLRRERELKVFLAAPSPKWAVFLIKSNFSPTLEESIGAIKSKAKAMEMTLGEPLIKKETQANEIVNELGAAAAAGCKFALIISDTEGDHAAIKYAERIYGISTQQVRGRNAGKLNADTGTNVCLKLNIKTGGMNFAVSDVPTLLEPLTMIMSLVFDHPTSMSKKEMEDGAVPTCPAVIAISSNSCALKKGGKYLPESCQNFTEKFAYANPREWKKEGPSFQDTVSELIKHEIEAFKISRTKPANQIFVYVSGVPEAERGYWAKGGREMVADVCHTFHQMYNPAVTIITLSTEGVERLVPEGGPKDKPDPRIGLIVDTVVVNPRVNEWFMQSAVALKGTPRSTKYTLVAEPRSDAARKTMDDLQRLTFALTHLHQYSMGTISFPAPSRIAGDAAKRARDLFKHSHKRGPINVEELNKEIGFKNEKVAAIRSV